MNMGYRKFDMCLRPLLTLLCLLIGVSMLWGEEAKIVFANQSNASDSNIQYTKDNFVKSGIESCIGDFGSVSCDVTKYCYSGKKDCGVKIGRANDGGELKLSFSKAISNVTSIIVSCASYKSETTVNITFKNGTTILGICTTANDNFEDFIISSLDIKSLGEISILSNKYCYVKSIRVVYSNDSRTAVNITNLTSSKTNLVVGETVATYVTNDQLKWNARYTYSSSDERVASVDGNGYVTAVGKGTATITAALDIATDDDNYKKGSVSSKTLEVTVKNPSHAYAFYSDGSVYSSGTCEEGEQIPFPALSPSSDGVVFMGWALAEIPGTRNDAPDFVESMAMGSGDVCFYAVYAKESGDVKEYVFTIGPEKFVGGGYVYNDQKHEVVASCLLDNTTLSVKYEIKDVMKYDGIQFRSGSGILYNTTDLGTIKRIALENSDNLVVYYGTSQQPASGTSVGGGYFAIKSNGGTGKASSITVTFEKGTATYSDYTTVLRKTSYSRAVEAGSFFTVCLPKAVVGGTVEGAKVYSLAGKVVNSEGHVTSVMLHEAARMDAGVPYICRATANVFKAMCADNSEVGEAKKCNGLCGVFTRTPFSELNDFTSGDVYVVTNTEIQKAGASSGVSENRAYIRMSEVPTYRAKAGVKAVRMSCDGLEDDDEETGISGIDESAESHHSSMTGRGGIHTLSGQRVQKAGKGIYIVDGKKILY